MVHLHYTQRMLCAKFFCQSVDLVTAFGIQGACGFIKQQYRGAGQKNADKAQPLALPYAERIGWTVQA